ncbi:MAG: DUF4058 family protein [Planctomycetes bacterium]|nr:DUF4058 family protein [Planctomycetota bacterium]
MSSPFPGMDPWLESPYIWGDFHQAFAGAMRGYLRKVLPKPFYARTDSRPEIGIVTDEGEISRHIGPDVAVARHPRRTGGVAAVKAVRAISENSIEIIVSNEPGEHVYVEVRDSSRQHQLVTLIEIVSPSNKRKGKDRRSYLKKQREVLGSPANLIEIDLLRSGKRLFASAEIEAMLATIAKRVDYVCSISRGWKRDELGSAFEVFPISVDEVLPCIPLPLTRDRPEIPLDLQQLMDEAYDTGPYTEGAVDYDQPADPPLPPELRKWAEERLRKAGMVA